MGAEHTTEQEGGSKLMPTNGFYVAFSQNRTRYCLGWLKMKKMHLKLSLMQARRYEQLVTSQLAA